MKKKSTVIASLIAALLLALPVFAFWLLAAFSGSPLHFLVPFTGVLLVILTGLITFCISNGIW